MAADPFAASEGTRKFTWYPFPALGSPTAPSTSASSPFTVTSTGEVTSAKGFDGNGWPGFSVALVGPRPVAKIDKISPAAAGFAALTSEKSLECVMAGPFAVIATSGRNAGITYSVNTTCPPPFARRLAGSSVTDARRMGTAAEPSPCIALPVWPWAPRNAPVPPTIAKLCDPAGGPGGDGPPAFSPSVMTVPTGVAPSLWRISYVSNRIEFRETSATGWEAMAVGDVQTDTPREVYVPLAGWPLTATMSPRATIGTLKQGAAPVELIPPFVMFGLVPNFERSE